MHLLKAQVATFQLEIRKTGRLVIPGHTEHKRNGVANYVAPLRYLVFLNARHKHTPEAVFDLCVFSWILLS